MGRGIGRFPMMISNLPNPIDTSNFKPSFACMWAKKTVQGIVLVFHSNTREGRQNTSESILRMLTEPTLTVYHYYHKTQGRVDNVMKVILNKGYLFQLFAWMDGTFQACTHCSLEWQH